MMVRRGTVKELSGSDDSGKEPSGNDGSGNDASKEEFRRNDLGVMVLERH